MFERHNFTKIHDEMNDLIFPVDQRYHLVSGILVEGVHVSGLFSSHWMDVRANRNSS